MRKQQILQFRKSRGVGGGGATPPPICKPSKNDFAFFALIPPKAISCGFSILCAGEDAFTHLIRFTKETLFHCTVFSCFFTPPRIRLAFAFLSVGEDASFLTISFSSLFNPLKRFRVALLVC